MAIVVIISGALTGIMDCLAGVIAYVKDYANEAYSFTNKRQNRRMSMTMMNEELKECFKNQPSIGSKQMKQTSYTSPHIHYASTSTDYTKYPCLNCDHTTTTASPPVVNASSGKPQRKNYLVNLLQLFNKWSYPRLQGSKDWFAALKYTLGMNYDYNRFDYTSKVLQSERVREGIEKAAVEMPEYSLSKLKRLAKKYFVGMRARVSVLLLRIVSYCIFKVIGRAFDGIILPESQMEAIRKAEKEKKSIVYLPLHRSHLDYVLVTFALFSYNLRVPMIASGDNLNFSCMGWVLRALGAFFIQRRMDKNVPEGKKDYVYRAVLHSYVESLLQNGEPIEFFMEGTRSRNGKTLMPKAGLMSIIVETVEKGIAEDALIVPVSCVYERVLDKGFVEELMGAQKKRESILGFIVSVMRALGRRYGHVRLDFGQPVSLKNLVAEMKALNKTGDLEILTLNNRSGASATSGSNVSLGRINPERAYSQPIVSPLSAASMKSSSQSLWSEEEEEKRKIVYAVCHHTLYEATHNSAVSSTQLLSCLLAGKYKDGAWLSQLVRDFAWISGEARLRGGDLIGGYGEPGNELCDFGPELPGMRGANDQRSFAAVLDAINLLGSGIIRVEKSRASETDERFETDSGIASISADEADQNIQTSRMFIRPLHEPKNQLLLNYYRNGAMHLFVLDAVIATAFQSFASNERILLETFVDRCESLAQSLSDQFYFCKPCQKLRHVFLERLEKFYFNNASCILRLLRLKRSPSPPDPLSESEWLEEIVADFEDDKWDYEATERPFSKVVSPEGIGNEFDQILQVVKLSEIDELYSIGVIEFYGQLLYPFIERLECFPDWLKKQES